MKQRELGSRGGAFGICLGPGMHGYVGLLRKAGTMQSPSDNSPRPGFGPSPSSIRRTSTDPTRTSPGRKAIKGSARGHPGHEIRQRAGLSGRQIHSARTQARVTSRPRAMPRWDASASPHRPVLSARVDRACLSRRPSVAMADLVRAGKCGSSALRGVRSDGAAARNAVHPITPCRRSTPAVERDRGGTRSCPPFASLGIGFGPRTVRSARGFSRANQASGRHCRGRIGGRNHPRFQGENFQKNLDLVGASKCCSAPETVHTPAQLALAWLLAKGKRHRLGFPAPKHRK